MMGVAYFLSRRFEEAVSKLRLAMLENPTFAEPYRVLAACYAHMGNLDDAREIIARLRGVTCAVMSDASRFRKPEHRELFLSGLRLAMAEPS
jgi:predicted Zn-dependent protease